MTDEVMERFSEPVRSWFSTTFAAPTAAQEEGWPAIAAGGHTLILAPTGSGKTLTAFLWALDRLTSTPPPDPARVRVVYVSPLRALAVDVDRNLRAPLEGIRLAGERLGIEVHRPEVAVRTGDTPGTERARLRRRPPDVLITTPESLYLMLTSQARETLRGVEAVIVDEIHAMAATKRGSHLAVTLERLEHEVTRGGLEARQSSRRPPQRIALSATQRPLGEIARFLGGYGPSAGNGSPARGPVRGVPRPVTIVDAGSRKPLDLEVVIPVEDLRDLDGQVEMGRDLELMSGSAAQGPSRRSIWPAVHPRLLDLVLEHRSTLIFVNARRLAERLAAKLNELHRDRLREPHRGEQGATSTLGERGGDELDDEPVPELVKAHHGSLSRERRLQIEDELKSGELRGLVATSSLELGIDMGAVDLVVQVASPGTVSRGLQRIGRAGHRVGEPSRGTLFPKYRGDLVETAVIVRGMRDGLIEATHYPRNPLDVLAQQIVAMTAVEEWAVDELAATIRRSAPFQELGDDVLEAVLDLLAGRYPSEEFRDLRPRIVWDRVRGRVRGRAGAQRLAVTNAGTIPDRGLFGVFLADGTRVGELDEEMVHESRPGETFVLGASTWRIEDITHERVVVTPAPGHPGKLPFWHGEGPGRPVELGRAIGRFQREVRHHARADRTSELARLRAEHDLDDWAAENLVAYLEEQAATAGAVPDDRTVVVERFRDELGDWRVCLLSPFGARVHAPWAMAIERRLRERGSEVELMWADDGIVLRLSESVGLADPASFSVDELLIDPDELHDLVVAQLSETALFTTLFREAAGRALLLPKRMPGNRTALWQQRRRAAELLQVASRYPSFPLLLEATREALRDVFDLEALREILGGLRSRKIRLTKVETSSASPFAQSLLFGWVGQYMYEYDAPLAERRAAALALDRDLLRELLGVDELRELVDDAELDAIERELQRLAPLTDDDLDRRARDVDELHDVLRQLGDLTPTELADRARTDPSPWIEQLLSERRAIRVRVAGDERIAAAEDAAKLRDGVGVVLPPGLPQAFTAPTSDPLAELVARFARTHGPFLTQDAARRLGIPTPRVDAALRWLQRQDRVVRGEFRPGGVHREWIDTEVLRRVKRRSMAALRAEVEPVDATTLARFLPAWQQVRGSHDVAHHTGPDAAIEVIGQLQGAPIPASVLEPDVLRARLADDAAVELDQLVAAGEVVWLGVEPLGRGDGRVVLAFRDQVGRVAPRPVGDPPEGKVHLALREHLADRGASFWPELHAAAGEPDQQTVLDALWDLVWAGEVTNDTYAPVRAFVAGGRTPVGAGAARRPRAGRLTRLGPPAARGRWSLTSQLFEPVTETVRAHALAEQLLHRHGVLTREAMRAEAVPGGFSAVYPVLRALEEAGHVRRGYAVAGLGAAQFAATGAIDRLRSYRSTSSREPTVLCLAAADPAQPYGAALPWPSAAGRPSRSAGAFVVLVDGEPAAYLERGGHRLLTFDDVEGPPDRWLRALTELVTSGRRRKLEIDRVDGVTVHDAPEWVTRLETAGFTRGYRGLTFRA